MDAVFEIIALIFRAIIWLMFCAFWGLSQAAAGILHPATEPKLVCYQRCAAVLAALSIAVLIVGLLIVNFANHSYGYIVIGVALLLMIVAGAAGSIVEHESKRASLKSSPLHKE